MAPAPVIRLVSGYAKIKLFSGATKSTSGFWKLAGVVYKFKATFGSFEKAASLETEMLFGARPRPRDFVDPFPEVVFLSVPGRPGLSIQTIETVTRCQGFNGPSCYGSVPGSAGPDMVTMPISRRSGKHVVTSSVACYV
ncbi:hypothetical protein BN1708_011240 [Verticillium longisporum]|uniref:Uncharacterized protein n=1 Tax=Verticillium longisporum TaxID=100787 RepID=A0A0G4KYE5_VERLO|nr:hypothetical protein BN1708_011240 [Verticillium longisporum]